jgi:hypothetical protein
MFDKQAHVLAFSTGVKRSAIRMGLLLAAEGILLLFLGRGDLISSLLLGGMGSYIYFFMLAHRVRKSADMDPLVAVRYMRAGLGVRLLFISMLSIFALKQGFHFLAVFWGIFTYQLVLRIEGSVTVVKRFCIRQTKL